MVLIQVFKLFNNLGITKSIGSTRQAIDTLSLECDKEAKAWKESVEVATKCVYMKNKNNTFTIS